MGSLQEKVREGIERGFPQDLLIYNPQRNQVEPFQFTSANRNDLGGGKVEVQGLTRDGFYTSLVYNQNGERPPGAAGTLVDVSKRSRQNVEAGPKVEGVYGMLMGANAAHHRALGDWLKAPAATDPDRMKTVNNLADDIAKRMEDKYGKEDLLTQLVGVGGEASLGAGIKSSLPKEGIKIRPGGRAGVEIYGRTVREFRDTDRYVRNTIAERLDKAINQAEGDPKKIVENLRSEVHALMEKGQRGLQLSREPLPPPDSRDFAR